LIKERLLHLSTRYGLIGMGALALLATVHQLRRVARAAQPTVDYLIGVLPNFAAAIAITFVLLSIWSEQNREAGFTEGKHRFFVCSSISGFGLTAWELFQRSSDRLVFDPHDVWATMGGVCAASLLFYAWTPRSQCRD
jgi:hypothetical protein